MVFSWPPKHIPNFKAALRDTKSSNAQFRRNAAISLGGATEQQRETASGALGRLFDDENRDVRLEAIVGATKIKARSLSGSIVKFLESNIPDERVAALEFFARVGDESHWQPVKELLSREKDPDVQCMALEALSCLNPEECHRMVLESLKDPEYLETNYLRTQILVLSEIGDLEDLNILIPFLEHHTISVRLETAHVIAMADITANERLMAAIFTDAAELVRDRRLKKLALEGLCRLKSEEIVRLAGEKFKKIFMSRWERIYWAAIRSRAGDGRATDYLKRIYGGKNIPLAAKVLWAAGLCRLKEWIPAMEYNIQRYLNGREDNFLYCSIASLGIMHRREAVEVLSRFGRELRTGHPDVADMIEGELEISEKLLRLTEDKSAG